MKEFLIQHGAFLFWAAVAVVSLIVEAMTAELVSCWFAPSAIVSMILSGFVDLFWVQLLVFLVLSAVLLLVARRFVKKKLAAKGEPALNADSLIGRTGIVQEAVNNVSETGSVKVGGLVWTARAADGNEGEIPAGTVVTIREIQGVKLICEPANEPETEQKQNEKE